jgi:formylglycine-generating enzyme required for sulfatase activity
VNRTLPWVAVLLLLALAIWVTLTFVARPASEEEEDAGYVEVAPLLPPEPAPEPPPPVSAPSKALPPPDPEPVEPPAAPRRVVPEVVAAEAPTLSGGSLTDARVLPVDPARSGPSVPFDYPSPFGPGGSFFSANAAAAIEIPGSWVWIGTPRDWLEGFARQNDDDLPHALFAETPRHRVEIGPFTIARREVTNQEWWIFLVTTARAKEVVDKGGETLRTMLERFLGPRLPSDDALAELATFQLFLANRERVLVARPTLVVLDPEGRQDLGRIWELAREAELPRGLELAFYRRPPPLSWPGARAEERLADHPVHGISALDATDYALWRGGHLPREEEWEYAVLGANGPVWPWGNDLVDFSDRVVGGEVRAATDPPPETVPAHLVTGGESWCGVAHGVGNVSEFTSSFLDPYPGGPPTHPLALRLVVVRGGSASDEDPYLMRPAFRGWATEEQSGEDRTPLATRPLRWTGLRLAEYDEPVASRIPSMHTRARAFGSLAPALLLPAPWAGVQGLLVEDLDPQREDPLLVPPGVLSVVAQPIRSAATFNVLVNAYAPFAFPADVELKGLVQASKSPLPLLLGLLHVDLPVLDCWTAPVSPTGKAQSLRRAALPPGTWLIGVWHGFVVALSPDLQQVFAFSNRPAPIGVLNVLEQSAPLRGDVFPGAVDVGLADGTRGEVEVRTWLAGGAGEPQRIALLRLRLSFDPRVLAHLVQREAGAAEAER